MYQKANAILKDSYEAEDAVQEALLRLFRIAARIDDPAAVKTKILAITVVKNIAIDLWRKKTHAIPTEDSVFLAQADTETTEQLIADKEHFSALIAEFLHMPEHYRAVLKLRCVYEFSAEETARLLGTNANTVNIRLARARKLLKTRRSVIASFFLVCIAGFLGVHLHTPLLVSDTENSAEEPALLGGAAPAADRSAQDTPVAGARSIDSDEEAAQEAASAADGTAQEETSATLGQTSENAFREGNQGSHDTDTSAAQGTKQAPIITSDQTENGVRTILFALDDTALKLTVSSSEAARTEALGADYALDAVIYSDEASGQILIEIKKRSNPDGLAACWEADGLYYALTTKQNDDASRALLEDVALAHLHTALAP